VTSKTPACIHRVLDGNVQEFVLTEASRQGVNELFDMAEKIMEDAHARHDMTIIAGRFLLDSSVGVLPLNYAFSRARQMASKFPSHPQARTALIFKSSPLTRTIDLFLRQLVSLRLYSVDERDQALAWLRAGAEAASKR
jgi:hypothetical protein